MDGLSGFAQILGQGFFPIVMCAVILYGGYKLFRYILSEGKTLIESIESRQAEETNKLSGVIERNTEVVQTVVDEIRGVESRLEKVEDKVDKIYEKEKEV